MPAYTPNHLGERPSTAPTVTDSSEYSRAYPSTRNPPRPRNPIPSWSTRNRSNILPPEPETHRPATATNQRPRVHQSWPWQERAIRSEIFTNPGPPDINNNSLVELPTRIEATQRMIWQRRGQASSGIFLFDRPGPDPEINNVRPAVRPNLRWPWQERAMQSKIFELPEERHTRIRSYQWDQRKSSPFFPENEPASASTVPRKTPKTWPWQQRAQQSFIFKAPDITSQPAKKYPWDQRQSVFDIKDDPNCKFKAISGYNEDFIQNQTDSRSIKAAGIKSYLTYVTVEGEAVKNTTADSTVSKSVEQDKDLKQPKEIIPLFETGAFNDLSITDHPAHFRDRTNTCQNANSSSKVSSPVPVKWQAKANSSSEINAELENRPPTSTC